MRLVALAAVASLVLSSCGTAPQSSTPTRSTPSHPPTEPAQWQDESWGPLAVVPPAEGALEAGPYKGTLRITEECVFLQGHRDEVLLWHVGRTRWNDHNHRITIDNPGSGSPVTVAHGDRVSMSGGADTYESFHELVEDVDATTSWISPPSPTCQANQIWVVSSLRKGSEP